MEPNTVPASFLALAGACAPQVAPATAAALVSVESSFNPYAIGVVGGQLLRQPRNRAEALATARALQAGGWNFSLGLAQINRHNLERLGLDLRTAFEPCRNLGAMQAVLVECHDRARAVEGQHAGQQTLRKALSCYYSGNFSTGRRDGYVQRVVRAAAKFTTRFDPTTTGPASAPTVPPSPTPTKEST